jgi:hypothetical protein
MALLGTGASRAARGGVQTVAAFKDFFFDSPKVLAAIDRANRKALSRFGAFVRRRARSSMKRRKNKVSRPGQPPFAKKGMLKNLLFFAFDPKTKSVVVGPATINGSPVPKTHEFGGFLRVRKKENGKRISKPVRFAERPFMAPALKAELPKFAAQFAGTIGG